MSVTSVTPETEDRDAWMLPSLKENEKRFKMKLESLGKEDQKDPQIQNAMKQAQRQLENIQSEIKKMSTKNDKATAEKAK